MRHPRPCNSPSDATLVDRNIPLLWRSARSQYKIIYHLFSRPFKWQVFLIGTKRLRSSQSLKPGLQWSVQWNNEARPFLRAWYYCVIVNGHLCVRLSFRHTRDSRLNGLKYRNMFCTTCTTERWFWFLEAEFRVCEFRGSPWMSVLKRGRTRDRSANLTNNPQ